MLTTCLDLESISAAIREEIAAAQESTKNAWLDIDGIEHLADVPGSFVYRLILSSPGHFSPDQAVTFHTRNPKDTIPATIVRADDDGLVVECQKPLPTDAKLLSLSFDPSFILRALESFLKEVAVSAGAIAELFVREEIPVSERPPNGEHFGLNRDQALAVEEMATTPLYLLWGPPGTGKTTTLGSAVARWLRQRKRVLIASTSNAAVDVALRAVLKNLEPQERQRVLRLGASVDPAVKEVTLVGKMAAGNAALAGAATKSQERLREIRELLQNRNLAHDRLHALFAEAQVHEKKVKQFNDQTMLAAGSLTSGVLVTACTLAKMVLEPLFRTSSFDVVIVDEASMASALYALAASFLATEHLVYAGDPKQLPPIVQASGRNAVKWFGQNVYDWFGVTIEDEVRANQLRLLQTQYRMTNEIGDVVSRLSYGGLLKHGRSAVGPRPEFIDLDGEWQTIHYSVKDASYFHLAAVPILHALSPLVEQDELLVLSPFRPQRSLLAALAFDLRASVQKRKMSASTIHRAQGSEAKAVVVDLTTHSPQRLAAFFKDRHCEQLFNVAISRAKDRLFVIGSRSMLRELQSTAPFWNRVIKEMADAIQVTRCDDLIGTLDRHDSLRSIPLVGAKDLPAIYSHQDPSLDARDGINMLGSVAASRKLLVLPDAPHDDETGDFIIRTSPNCASVFVAGGTICIPYGGKWLAVKSPNASRVVWRIGFAHLADAEVDPLQARRFFCPECSSGELRIKKVPNEGYRLLCSNAQDRSCYYQRRLGLEDAKLKVRLFNMTCPSKHPLTARVGKKGVYFLGCENYPACEHTERLSLLEGM